MKPASVLPVVLLLLAPDMVAASASPSNEAGPSVPGCAATEAGPATAAPAGAHASPASMPGRCEANPGGMASRPAAIGASRLQVANEPVVATFSIVAADPEAGEVGVAVASKFFAVGSVVPWARADVGAAATQAYANTSWGPKALDLLAAGLTPAEALEVLKRGDSDPGRRQFGLVTADGRSVTYTGEGCTPWAGGRSGKNYAIQGNILAGEWVVDVMEKKFLGYEGEDLADRLFQTLRAGDAAGGDARGRQSAALIVYRAQGGYGGFNDRAIDVRVDDNPEPFPELGRILKMARVNDLWNRGWTLFMDGKFPEALVLQEKTASIDAYNAEVWYDLGVIRLAAGKRTEALEALKRAIEMNAKLASQAKEDKDLAALRGDPAFAELTKSGDK